MADFRSTFTVVPQKRTFGLFTFGLYSFQSATLAGPIIDLTYWGQQFTTTTPDIAFEQALQNMDPVEFVDLLYTEGFFSKDIADASLYARGKGTFYPQTFRMQTFTGIPFKIGAPATYRGLASLAGPVYANAVPADTGENAKWASTVAHEMRHLQPTITLEKLRPEGILTHLLLKPDGSLIKYWRYQTDGTTPANDRGNKAMQRCLKRLSDIYTATPTKLLTTKTKANIAARDGYNSSSSGTAETHYAYTSVEAVNKTAANSPQYSYNSNGRLLFDWGAFQPARVPFWDKQSGGASDKYPTMSEPEGLNDTFVGDASVPIVRQFPIGYYAIHTLFDFSHYDSYQEVKLTWQQATQNLVQNGDFSSGGTNWTTTGTVTFPSNTANFSGVSTLSQNITGLTSGIPYRLKFTLTQNGAVSLQLDITASWLDPPSPFQSTSFFFSGPYVVDFKLPSGTTSDLLKFTTAAGANVAIDDVKIAALMHGTFKLGFGGQETSFIDAALRVRAANDIISTTTDLRYAIDAGLRNLSTVPLSPAGQPAVGAYFRSDSTETTAHPLEGAMTKVVDVFFFNPAKSGHIWPNGPGFSRRFGYFHPELSRESNMTWTRGTLPDPTGSVMVTPTFDYAFDSDALLHNYIDFLDDRGEPIRDSKNRAVVALKNSNWAWWVPRFMEAWWGDFKALAVSPPATIDHLINDHEQTFDFDDVRLDLRYGDSRTGAGQNNQVQDFHAQRYFNTYWRPLLGQTISDKVALGSDWLIHNSDVSAATLDYQVWTDVFRGSGRLLESKMLYSAVYQACAKHFPNVTAGSWWGYTHSIGLIADVGVGNPIYQVGWVQGTHQSHALYGAEKLLGAIGKHAVNIPYVAERRTWIPQSTAKVKRIRRETISISPPRGRVTIEVFGPTETNAAALPENRTAVQLQSGNDQYLNGLREGHLAEVLDGGALADTAAAFAAFRADFPPDSTAPYNGNRATKFAVTLVGHMEGDTFVSGPDGTGIYTACQYIDTLRGAAQDWMTCSVSVFNRGLQLDTTSGWNIFLSNIQQLRSMFLASAFPISCWHGSENYDYFATQQRQYRLEVYFHSKMHGENHRHWYNTKDVTDIDPAKQRDSEKQTQFAMQELDTVCPYQLVDARPLSLNYRRPSMQFSDYAVSGVSIPGNRRMLRVTLKDRKWFNDTGTPQFASPVGKIREQTSPAHVDFRTLTGHVLRVPGRVFTFPGGSSSQFQHYGWWIEILAS